jgi:hypothetical protein
MLLHRPRLLTRAVTCRYFYSSEAYGLGGQAAVKQELAACAAVRYAAGPPQAADLPVTLTSVGDHTAHALSDYIGCGSCSFAQLLLPAHLSAQQQQHLHAAAGRGTRHSSSSIPVPHDGALVGLYNLHMSCYATQTCAKLSADMPGQAAGQDGVQNGGKLQASMHN